MPREPVTRRVPLWAVLCAAWWIHVGLPWGEFERWRPELLLIIVTHVALRSTPQRAAVLGGLAGWGVALVTPLPAGLLLGYWVALGAGCGWLRAQWHTEDTRLFLILVWLAVMGWHGLTWLAKAGTGAVPRAWDATFLAVQTCVTLACAALWDRYALRWVAVRIAEPRPGAVAFLHRPAAPAHDDATEEPG